MVGTIEQRATSIAEADPMSIDLVADAERRAATLTVMLPLESPDTKALAWDTGPATTSEDVANETAVAAARLLAAACPELQLVEVITVTASGLRYRVGGFEPGHKTMPRDAFPDRTQVRRSVGFQAALRRVDAAQSWTSMLRRQISVANDLTVLVTKAVARISRRDNAGPRHAWAARVTDTIARTSAMQAKPATTGVDIVASHAQADDAERQRDRATDALQVVAQALPRILDTVPTTLMALAMTFNDAARDLAKAAQEANASITGLGQPIPDELVRGCRRLGHLLAALHADPSAATQIRAADPTGSADAIIDQARTREDHRQRTALSRAVAGVPGAELHRIRTDNSSIAISGTWLVVAPIESWPTLVETMSTIPVDVRNDLRSTLVAAARADDSDEVLPIALQLLIYGDQTEMPLPAELLRPHVEGAGLRLAVGGLEAQRLSSIVESLVVLSWTSARDRARPRDWPVSVPLASERPNLGDLAQLAAEATSSLGADRAEAARAAVEVLFAHVRRELAGEDVPSLAGELQDAAGAILEVPAAPELWQAFEILTAVSLGL